MYAVTHFKVCVTRILIFLLAFVYLWLTKNKLMLTRSRDLEIGSKCHCIKF